MGFLISRDTPEMKRYSIFLAGIVALESKISRTRQGYVCQYWNVSNPHVPQYTPKSKNHNYCRNPDNDPKGPWCYTTNPSTRYDYCDVPDLASDINSEGTTCNTTVSGYNCQRWDKNYPHYPATKPDPANHNYCSIPVDDNDETTPWCYTTSPAKRWEYCASDCLKPHIRLKQVMRMGHNGEAIYTGLVGG